MTCTSQWAEPQSIRLISNPISLKRMTPMTSLTYRLYIDGAWNDSDGDEVLRVVNPATEEIIGPVPQAPQATWSARSRPPGGRSTRALAAHVSPRERAAVMLRMADVMERRAAELIDLNVREAGSIRALAESLQVGIPLEHFRDMAERVLLQFAFEKPMLPTSGRHRPGRRPPRAVRRRRADLGLQLPVLPQHVQARAGPGRRLHGGAQARAHHPARGPHPRRDRRRGRAAARRAQHRHRRHRRPGRR